MEIETPRTAPVRPLADLAEALGVTRAAIYAAANRGDIGGTVRVGAHRKIRAEAYAYHAEHGFGHGVLPFGQVAEAEAAAE